MHCGIPGCPSKSRMVVMLRLVDKNGAAVLNEC